MVGRRHYTERIEGGGYNREEYEQYPHLYKSTFSKKVSITKEILFLYILIIKWLENYNE